MSKREWRVASDDPYRIDGENGVYVLKARTPEIARADRAEADNAALRAEMKEMAAALEQFAMVGAHDIRTDETDADLFRPLKYNLAGPITVGHLLHAARVLVAYRERNP